MATRFDPIRDIDRFISEVTRSNSTTLPMDLFRDGENYVARIDMPGVRPESIDVDVEDRTLTVRAEREVEAGEGVEWLTRERPTGTAARQLTLGNRIAVDRIVADFSDGVLTLTIPVSEEAKPRKISISHGGNTTSAPTEPNNTPLAGSSNAEA
ncbi:Hsp20/alpha crystallin family protein [uncultured Brevibacterium sp.]|uniref:Hsp20/alpha crystallin family protein n=1 Tax=uncultured Brevibacterium sp. TaxID=189678 RepID=UPI0025CD627F|nr:Hsp20/alpha crystallin family protein [uncultured Brevibacterium sp.]